MRQKYFAGFQLASLHTLRPTLALCFAVAMLQIGYTYFQLQHGALAFVDIAANHMNSIFRGGLLLIGISATISWRNKSNYSYFLRRLQISSPNMGFLWSANAFCCLLLFWGTQVVTLWGCSAMVQASVSPDLWSHQTFLIDCYRSDFLHAVLPMGDGVVWVRNLLSLLAIALAKGYTMVTAWRGGQPVLSIFTLVAVGLTCASSGTGVDYFMLFIYACICLGAVLGILHAEEDTP